MNLNLRPHSIASARKINSLLPIAAEAQTQINDAPVVIVGGGPSGIRVAQELARSGCKAILFNAERWKPYNRVKLTPLLSGDVQLGQVTQPHQFPGPGKVALYSDNSIIDIDRAEKTVTTKLGRTWC